MPGSDPIKDEMNMLAWERMNDPQARKENAMWLESFNNPLRVIGPYYTLRPEQVSPGQDGSRIIMGPEYPCERGSCQWKSEAASGSDAATICNELNRLRALLDSALGVVVAATEEDIKHFPGCEFYNLPHGDKADSAIALNSCTCIIGKFYRIRNENHV